MNRTVWNRLSPLQLAALAGIVVGGSAAIAVGVLLIVRMGQARALADYAEKAEEVPIQPSVATSTSSEVPHHFTEDIVVPDKTFTGLEIVEQDDQIGRSPEGV